MKYRSEIDGLRAIAVVPVILFHAGFGLFQGGFVGVDIFFVISGYLITSLLIEDIENHRFSILKFYERRARRILPALFFVMICAFVFAWVFLLPIQMMDFGKSIISVATFSSNILFWRDTGYFDGPSELKPLLHTWSLSVEEQFYLFFPIMLILTWRFGKNRVFWIIVVTAACSLALSEWGWRNKPSANFFLLPTRVWELFAGSIAAFIVHKHGVRSNAALSAVGFMAVIFSIFIYTEATPFPSLYALLPVGGIVLLILFCDQTNFVGKALSNKLFVGVGLISYSAYLWHQPLFAFARIVSIEHPSLLLMSSLIIATLVLAVFSWRFVEQPFRSGPASIMQRQSTILAVSAAAMVAFAALGAWVTFNQGVKSRIPDAVLQALDFRSGDTSDCHNGLTADQIAQGQDCPIGSPSIPPRIAMIGDSHASRLTDAFSDFLASRDQSGITFNGSWCVPLMHLHTTAQDKSGCVLETNAAFEQVAARSDIDVVVLAAEWGNYTQGYRGRDASNPSAHLFSEQGAYDWGKASPAQNPAEFEEALRFTLNFLTEAGKDIVFVMPTPEHYINIPNFLAHVTLYQRDIEDYPELVMDQNGYDIRNAEVVAAISAVSQENSFTVVDVLSAFCEEGVCALKDTQGRSLYQDEIHLSYHGAERVVQRLIPAIE